MLKKYLSIDRQMAISILLIALPVALQNVISFGVNLMDSLMLAQLGDVAISSANFGTKPFFLLFIFGFGISSGGSVLIAQYWGKGQLKPIRQLFSINVQILLLVSSIFCVVCFFFPSQIMRIFVSDPQIIEGSSIYLKTLSLSFIFYSLANCYMLSLRAIERVNISLFVYAISFVINVFFNFCFIFGKFGFKAYGVQGAAMGTLVARICEFLMVLAYMYLKENTIKFRPHHVFDFKNNLWPSFFKHSLPVVGNELFWGLGTLAVVAIMGHIGKAFATAYSIADIVNQIVCVTIVGLSNAAAVITGKTIGEGKLEKAQKNANSFLIITLIISVVNAIIVLLIRKPFLSLYNITDEAYEIAYIIITVIALLEPVMSLSHITIVGILRGGGDTKYAFFIDVGCLWAFAVPLGMLGAFYLSLPVFLTYLLLRSDLFLKSILGIKRTLSGKWITDVTVK